MAPERDGEIGRVHTVQVETRAIDVGDAIVARPTPRAAHPAKVGERRGHLDGTLRYAATTSTSPTVRVAAATTRDLGSEDSG